VPDWLLTGIGDAVVVGVLLLFLRSRHGIRAPQRDVGPDSTPEEFDAEVERDLEVERLNTRPKL
jgi:hypothetical protein